MKMNSALKAFLLLIPFIILVFFTSHQFMETNYLSEAEVKEIVFKHSSTSSSDVFDFVLEKTTDEEGTFVYNVSYCDSKGAYIFKLDPKTGKVMDSFINKFSDNSATTDETSEHNFFER